MTPPSSFEMPARPATVPADWPTYHLAHPGPGEAMPGDPNCAFLWQGRYHLHYIYRNTDSFAFAHVSSTDLVHWRWHPTTLTPSFTGHGMYSGTGFLTAEGRPAIIYHGEGSNRNQLALAEDDQLERWTRPWALEPVVRPDQDGSTIANWDPDAWCENGRYFALSGGNPGSGKPPTLFASTDLKHWDFLGLFLAHDMPDVKPDEDISCPNFFPIGDRHMLLCISHTLGCRYYLGRWDGVRFAPEFHARMNWNGWDFFAPESLVTADGRRVMWAWCNLPGMQSGIQSLPRELSLPADGILRIQPARELDVLRHTPRTWTALTARTDRATPVAGLSGDTLELRLEATLPAGATLGLTVHARADGSDGFPIVIDPGAATLRLGTMDVPFALPPGEALDLRVFLDRAIIEVFVNGRQAALACHAHPADQVQVSLLSIGADVTVRSLSAWQMRSIYTP